MNNLKTKTLFGIKNPIWWVQEGDGCLFNTYYPAFSSSQVLIKYFPFAPKITICFCHQKKFVWVYEAQDMMKIAKKIVQLTKKDPNYLNNYYGLWQRQVKSFYQLVNKIHKLKFSELSVESLIFWFNKFDQAYKCEYALPVLPDQYFNYAEEILLPKIKRSLKPLPKIKQEKAYLALFSPTQPSFIKQAHWSLLKLAGQYKNRKRFKKLLEQHVRNFYWLRNNYTYSQYLNEKYWLVQVKKYLAQDCQKALALEKKSFEKVQIGKKYYLRKLNFSRQTLLELKIQDLFSIWQDQRKQANMIANGVIDKFLKELARRVKINFWLLKHLVPDEFNEVLRDKKVDRDLLRRRLRFSVVAIRPEQIEVLAWPQARQLYRRMFLKKVKRQKSIKGIVANPGKVSGRVKLITSAKQFANFKPGQILVAAMTRPDYSVILPKALAIITDEGGLACHAAIVARELNIPCIISTKIATKVLKDGDQVEVNANDGVVRIIK